LLRESGSVALGNAALARARSTRALTAFDRPHADSKRRHDEPLRASRTRSPSSDSHPRAFAQTTTRFAKAARANELTMNPSALGRAYHHAHATLHHDHTTTHHEHTRIPLRLTTIVRCRHVLAARSRTIDNFLLALPPSTRRSPPSDAPTARAAAHSDASASRTPSSSARGLHVLAHSSRCRDLPRARPRRSSPRSSRPLPARLSLPSPSTSPTAAGCHPQRALDPPTTPPSTCHVFTHEVHIHSIYMSRCEYKSRISN